ncbi:L-seryl-tRNA(Sec) selenium transferase [Lachnospiraceae bacterium XBB1006]|nr:L-seryl-tRNA(Sec) selenium transferase [Lachnospiraceae bacterium XBB1006]
MNKNELFRKIPKVDVLMSEPRLQSAIERFGKEPVITVLRDALEELRKKLNENPSEEILENFVQTIQERVLHKVEDHKEANLKHVVNATGVILHTNLGRAPLPPIALEKLMEQMKGYMNLEYNLSEGKRGERYSHFEELLCRLTGAEAAMAVNNNAAAALLMVSAVGDGKEVIVSRGEQIEIGGKFRIPDIIDQSGCQRVEVGTTNKTRLEDYEDAITEETGAFLKVHTSNYKLVGFTQSVERDELCALAKKTGIPVIEDLGSGVLIDLSRYGLRKEPTVQESIAAGVDVVCFSGDKLLGGPQAGILVGKREWIAKCKKHPLTRAMRIDKCTAAMLETVLSMYEDEHYAVEHIPVLSRMTMPVEELKEKADSLAGKLVAALPKEVNVSIVKTETPIGGGSLPGELLKSYAVMLGKEGMNAEAFAASLREGELPIIARVSEDCILLDLRTMYEEEFDAVVATIKAKM